MDKNYCKNQRADTITVAVKRSAEYYIANKVPLKRKAKNRYKTGLKKKKKQKENVQKINTKT